MDRFDTDDRKEAMLAAFAESELMKLIKEGNVAATIFFLKTQGKKRGYVERQEVTGAEGAPIIEIIGNI